MLAPVLLGLLSEGAPDEDLSELKENTPFSVPVIHDVAATLAVPGGAASIAWGYRTSSASHVPLNQLGGLKPGLSPHYRTWLD